MIKIYADLHKDEKYTYVEDIISSHDLTRMNKKEFRDFIKNFIDKYGEIHVCYSRFINKVGGFIQSYGKRWCGQEFIVYTNEFNPWGKEIKRKTKHRYDSKGYLSNWTIGYFD